MMLSVVLLYYSVLLSEHSSCTCEFVQNLEVIVFK